MTLAEPLIAARSMTKSYGRSRGVVELTFDVLPGEVFGYLGPNGAGKTTTIRTLLDFIRPTAGRATLFGMDSHLDATAIHRRLGYLPGELRLYERLTGSEYLRYLASLRGGVPRARIEALAGRLDLDLGQRIRSLSHGNKQKVGLVQALMHDPELLVLDEPTQGLDPLVQREFYALMNEAREEGRAVFLSSHVLPEVDRVCDRVAIIREGRLVTVEDIGDLKAKALRTLDIHFEHPAPVEPFARLPGVRSVTAQGDVLHLTVEGVLDPVVKTAARFAVVDLATHEPSLEDVFLAFYGTEAADAA